MEDKVLEQIRDELLTRAYSLAIFYDILDKMILNYECIIGNCKVHVAIDVRRLDDDN